MEELRQIFEEVSGEPAFEEGIGGSTPAILPNVVPESETATETGPPPALRPELSLEFGDVSEEDTLAGSSTRWRRRCVCVWWGGGGGGVGGCHRRGARRTTERGTS